MTDPPTYRLTLRPEGAGPPAIIRLRHLLKLALRTCGLRCVEVVEVPVEDDSEITKSVVEEPSK